MIQVPEFQGSIIGHLFWLTGEQLARLQPYFPKSHGKPSDDKCDGVRTFYCLTKGLPKQDIFSLIEA